MKCRISKDFCSSLLILTASIVSGALAGATAGWLVGEMPRELPIERPVVKEEPVTPATSTTYADLTIVSIDRASADPIVPPAFVDRRISPTASVYRRPAKNVSALREQDLIGQAVAVTSDGWFVMPAEAFGQTALSDVAIWFNGKAVSVQSGILDERGGVVFLKTDIRDGSAPSFARFQDVVRGLSVWVERRSGSFEPMMISALGEEIEDARGVLSDVVSRRGMLSGFAEASDAGAPVWGSNGSLIGLLSRNKIGQATFLPASGWAPSLFGIFFDGNIRHATLGVSAVDLSRIRLIDAPESLPGRGAWVMGDASKNLDAVATGSPADLGGLKEGDVILRVDRDILDGRADLAEILVQYKPDSPVVLTVDRAGETIEIPVTLGSKAMSRTLK